MNRALLLIDVQNGFDDPCWGIRNNIDAEKKISTILEVWRNHQWPIIHVQHCSLDMNSPLRPDQEGVHFKEEATPIDGEKIIKKNFNSAFIGTDLKEYLDHNSIKELVIIGFTTDHCVSTTTRMASNLGYKVILVKDATATFSRRGLDGETYSAEEIHKINLISLRDEFCEIVDTQLLLNLK